jgi:hypothetical protein
MEWAPRARLLTPITEPELQPACNMVKLGSFKLCIKIHSRRESRKRSGRICSGTSLTRPSTQSATTRATKR